MQYFKQEQLQMYTSHTKINSLALREETLITEKLKNFKSTFIKSLVVDSVMYVKLHDNSGKLSSLDKTKIVAKPILQSIVLGLAVWDNNFFINFTI